MKLFIILLALAMVCVAEVPFSLQFVEEQEIDTWIAELRGIDIIYPGILVIHNRTAPYGSVLRGYMLDTWEQYYSTGFNYEIRGLCTDASATNLAWNDIDNNRIHMPNHGFPRFVENPAAEPWGLATPSQGLGYMYETDGSEGIWIMNHADTVFVETPEITVDMRGLSEYGPWGESLLAITVDQRLHYWDTPGFTLSYAGSISIPITADVINGVAWDLNIPDKLYLSYGRDDVWYIGEFSLEEPGALEAATWGSIKSSF